MPVSHQPLRHQVPVSPIEQLFLHMIGKAGPWWARRMLVVEDQLGRFILSRFQETHHLSVVQLLLTFACFAPYLRDQAMSNHSGLKVGGRSTLRNGQIG